MVEITSSEQFTSWRQNKRNDWGQVIAARSALRVLPFAFEQWSPEEWVSKFALDVIRANFMSWATQNLAYDMGVTANEAVIAVRAAADAINDGSRGAALAAINGSAYAAPSAVIAAVDACRASMAADSTVVDASSVAAASNATGCAFAAADFRAGTDSLWMNVSDDCNWLENFIDEAPVNASRRLTQVMLWPVGEPKGWFEKWQLAADRLRNLEQGYDVWIDWYERRINSNLFAFNTPAPFERRNDSNLNAFDIPGDKNRKADKAIIARLADATNEGFWDNGAKYVNETLQGWIDELTPPKAVVQLDDLEAEPQNPQSPQFTTDGFGRIAINATANANQLRNDAEAMSRYIAAKVSAETLRSTLKGHNNAGYISDQADKYLEALGPDFGAIQPSMVVLHGERLRQSIASHHDAVPNDNLQPLPEAANRDAGGLLAAHNMLVGLDPYLDKMDRAVLGPDVEEPMVMPAEVRIIASQTADQGILAPESRAILEEAADLAPAVPDLANRKSRFLSGMAQNFVRYAIEFLYVYRNEVAWASALGGAAALAKIGVVTTGGATIIAYKLARYILANEDTFRRWAGSSPASVANMDRLIAFLKTLPLKSLND